MLKYDKGGVLFDRLTVMGREFVTTTDPLETCYWDYIFEVSPYLSKEPKKKKADPVYDYNWGGHINIGVDKSKIHLHAMEDDYGLVHQEAKLKIIQDTIKEFIKLYKGWGKEEKEPVAVRKWLNPEESHFTGKVAYHLNKNGSGGFSIGDCHKTIVIWVYLPFSMVGPKNEFQRVIKQLEEIAKGAGKAIGAIQQLRKFFERELTDTTEKAAVKGN